MVSELPLRFLKAGAALMCSTDKASFRPACLYQADLILVHRKWALEDSSKKRRLFL